MLFPCSGPCIPLLCSCWLPRWLRSCCLPPEVCSFSWSDCLWLLLVREDERSFSDWTCWRPPCWFLCWFLELSDIVFDFWLRNDFKFHFVVQGFGQLQKMQQLMRYELNSSSFRCLQRLYSRKNCADPQFNWLKMNWNFLRSYACGGLKKCSSLPRQRLIYLDTICMIRECNCFW